VLDLRLAVLFEKAAGALAAWAALVEKMHDVPRRPPGLCAGAGVVVLSFGREGVRPGSQAPRFSADQRRRYALQARCT
jgi:hypothetical protein